MTQEEKQVLLKDLCARLPYGVIVQYKGHNSIVKNKLLTGSDLDCNMEYYKPYLRPMSSMTEEEKRHISKMTLLRTYDNGVVYDIPYDVYTPYYVMEDCLNYLRSIHIDYSGLIEKELAIEVTEENNPYKE